MWYNDINKVEHQTELSLAYSDNTVKEMAVITETRWKMATNKYITSLL